MSFETHLQAKVGVMLNLSSDCKVFFGKNVHVDLTPEMLSCKMRLVVIDLILISGYCFFFIPPESMRKPIIF